MKPHDGEVERTGIYVAAISTCAVGAIGTAAYSGYHWLRHGALSPITLGTIVSTPHSTWRGLDWLIGSIWSMPMWSILIVAAFVLIRYMDRSTS